MRNGWKLPCLRLSSQSQPRFIFGAAEARIDGSSCVDSRKDNGAKSGRSLRELQMIQHLNTYLVIIEFIVCISIMAHVTVLIYRCMPVVTIQLYTYVWYKLSSRANRGKFMCIHVI